MQWIFWLAILNFIVGYALYILFNTDFCVLKKQFWNNF